jgi:hypothetical protein
MDYAESEATLACGCIIVNLAQLTIVIKRVFRTLDFLEYIDEEIVSLSILEVTQTWFHDL